MPKGPFHIVNSRTGKHLGPFTTELDAAMAKTLDVIDSGWFDGKTMDREQFKQHMGWD